MHPGRLGIAGARGRLADCHAVRRDFCLSLVSFGDYDFVYVVHKKVQKLMSILLHVIIKLFLLFAQSSDELFGCYRAHLLFLCRDGIESKIENGQNDGENLSSLDENSQIRKAAEQSLLVLEFVLQLVFQDLIAERFAEIERLKH